MAGDWIKMRCDLLTHPKVVRMMSALHADKLRVVGGLHAVWCLFDVHSIDGNLDGYTPAILDTYLGWDGFGQAMIDVGWLEYQNETLMMPRFEQHNGKSAKRRAEETERKMSARKAQTVCNVSASDADKKRSREEKRREENISTTNVVDKRAKKLPEDFAPSEWHTDYAQKNNLPLDEAFAQFCDYHKAHGSTMKDWPAALRTWLRNAVSYRKTSPPKTAYFDKLQDASNRLTGRSNAGATYDVD